MFVERIIFIIGEIAVQFKVERRWGRGMSLNG